MPTASTIQPQAQTLKIERQAAPNYLDKSDPEYTGKDGQTYWRSVSGCLLPVLHDITLNNCTAEEWSWLNRHDNGRNIRLASYPQGYPDWHPLHNRVEGVWTFEVTDKGLRWFLEAFPQRAPAAQAQRVAA